MRFFRMTPLAALSLLTLTGLSFAGCGSDNSIGPSGNSFSQVRGFNALQGCPVNVDIAQQSASTPTASNLVYGVTQNSGAYVSIRAGNGLNYAVYPTGTTTNPVATASFDLGPHDTNSTNNTGTYTLVAEGLCSGGTGNFTPHLVRLVDSFPYTFTGANSGTIALRLVNLSPDAGNISLFSNGAALTGTGTDTVGTSSVPYVVGSGYDGSHYTSGISVANPLNLTIRNSANTQIGAVPGTFAPTGNHAYTVFVLGYQNPPAGGQALTVVPVQDF